MKRFLFAAGVAGWLVLPPVAFGHSPFDCSTRVYLHAASVEVGISTGLSLGEQFLTIARITPARLPQGRPVSLPVTMATNFYDVSGDSMPLNPRAADVVTDGVEYLFRFEFSLPPVKTLGFKARFLPALGSPHAAALVLTDENGNLIGSAVLSDASPQAELPLPASTIPRVTNADISRLAPVTGAPRAYTVARPGPSFGEFFQLGLNHILTGYDHLLFLLALLLGCRCVKTMLWVITGFTLAHSLTLALAALDVIALPPRFVEPAIGFSIIFVAAENFRRVEKTWQRYTLTCGFGLIHGFGFASALRESGLGGQGSGMLRSLLAFNLGVEVGQLCVAALVLPLLFWLRKILAFEKHGGRLISALVMLVAAFWLWQRLRW